MMNKKIIISFTSYPRRIKIVEKVVKSLFQQTIQPDEIILWLSLEEFSEKEKSLPKNLCDLIGMNGFKICWKKENLRSHKKYYYVLQEYCNDIVITVDDDMYYSPTMVEELLNTYRKYPFSVSARNVRMILKEEYGICKYNLWDGYCNNYAGAKKGNLCAIGCAGILYPPHIASERWFDKGTLEKICLNQDDLWLKFNQILDGVSVAFVQKRSNDLTIMEAQENALYKTNIYCNQNDISIDKLCHWSKKENYNQFNRWYEDLYEYKMYYEKKREKLSLELRDIINSNIEKKIYICGAGKFARALIKLFKYCQKEDRILGLLVSSYNDNSKTLDNIPILLKENLKGDKNSLIICGV